MGKDKGKLQTTLTEGRNVCSRRETDDAQQKVTLLSRREWVEEPREEEGLMVSHTANGAVRLGNRWGIQSYEQRTQRWGVGAGKSHSDWIYLNSGKRNQKKKVSWSQFVVGLQSQRVLMSSVSTWQSLTRGSRAKLCIRK